jgi:hypothetical protein
LSSAERLEHGRLTPIPVDVPDTTVTEAMSALDPHFDAWR